MTCTINKKCVNCEMCEPECPHGAISFNGKTFVVNESLCTECEGIYPTPHCMEVCPVNCIKRSSKMEASPKNSNQKK